MSRSKTTLTLALVLGVLAALAGYAGLKLKGHDILLTDVAHAIEDLPLPDEVRAYYPGLTDADWAAATRMITMLLVSLDRAVR